MKLRFEVLIWILKNEAIFVSFFLFFYKKWSKVVGDLFFVFYNNVTRSAEAMFLGTYRHQIDQKNRMRVPAKFKNELAGGFVVTKGTNSCLFVLPKENNELFEKLAALPVFDVEAQKSVRAILSSAFEAEEDAQGRVLLPKELVAHAKIKKNIVFVGVGARVEIWAEEEWDAYNSGESFDKSIETLSKHGV